MNTQDDMAGGRLSRTWAGFDRLLLSADGDAVVVTIGTADRWDRAHLRRLRQSADLPGLVPVIDADISTSGHPYAVTAAVDAANLASQIGAEVSDSGGWAARARACEAAARAVHDAHLRGLFHGGLTPDDILFVNDDVAVAGVGLGLGGSPQVEVEAWIAPEVQQGQEPTERSDVYSLGKILEAVASGIDDVPRPLRRLIMWSTSDTPEARPPSALEFAGILNEALDGAGPAYGPAFIPTAELASLAAGATTTVDRYEPESSPSQASTIDDAAAVTTAATLDNASNNEATTDRNPDDTPDLVDSTGTERPSLSAQPSGSELTDEESDDIPSSEIDSDSEGALSQDDADVANKAAIETNERSDRDLRVQQTALTTPSTSSAIEALDSSDDLPVPAAARTIDIDAPDQRGGGRVPLLIGGLLAVGLGAIGYNLLVGDDGGETSAEIAAEVIDGDDARTDDNQPDPDDNTPGTDDNTPGTDDNAPSAPSTLNEQAADARNTGTAGTPDLTTSVPEGGTAAVDSETGESTTSDESDGSDTVGSRASDASVDNTTEDPDGATGDVQTGDQSHTDNDPDTDTAAATPAELATGPISADEAGVQVLHGMPDTPVDVYIDGEGLAPAFAAGTVAGPVDLDAGTYDIALFTAAEGAPASANDREDEPVLRDTLVIGNDPATVIAHFDEGGSPVLTSFAEDLSPVKAGSGRITLRHVAAVPAVDIWLDGETVGDGLTPGSSYSVVLPAGLHDIKATLGDGTPVISTQITVSEGQLTSVAVYGSADEGVEVAIQRFTGLSSAPIAVPTGDSNLLNGPRSDTGLYWLASLAALMAALGGVVLARQRQRPA